MINRFLKPRMQSITYSTHILTYGQHTVHASPVHGQCSLPCATWEEVTEKSRMEIIQEGLSVEEFKQEERKEEKRSMEKSKTEKETEEKRLININRKCDPVNNHGKSSS
jgi:hypothetical protein